MAVQFLSSFTELFINRINQTQAHISAWYKRTLIIKPLFLLATIEVDDYRKNKLLD